MTCLIRIENGYAYIFEFTGDSKSTYYNDFESLLASVKYPEAKNKSSAGIFAKPSAINIFLSFFVTIFIYSAPIFVYRYGIAKRPVEKTRAKRITIIYGIVAFAVMSVLILAINGNGATRGAIVLWSWVNYKVLTAEGSRKVEKTGAERMIVDTTAEDPDGGPKSL